jgi:DsbC/DsbD-like thiol-disulfide interchange protein
MRRGTILVVPLLLLGNGAGADAQPVGGRHVRTSLVAETDAVVPGQPLVVGFHLRMDPGWHTYWRNPGDSGLPTKARWELPEGFSAGELQWPRPIQFHTGPLVSYGYAHEVLHAVQIHVPASVGPGEVRLAARLSWLECKEACLPGKAELTLTLPVRAKARPGPQAALFEEARRLLPRAEPGWSFAAAARAASIDLTVRPPRGTALSRAYFYPVPRRLLDYSKPQPLAPVKGGYRLELSRDPNGAASVESLTGVLVVKTADDERAIEVDVPVKTRPAARAAAVAKEDQP